MSTPRSAMTTRRTSTLPCIFACNLVPTLAFAILAARIAAAQVFPSVPTGFPNVPQVPGALLSGLNAPEQGRTAVIAYHGGVLFTIPEIPSSQPGADWQVRTWDISDPAHPVELAQWGTTPHPISAHGYTKVDRHLVAGPNWPPGGEWTFRVADANDPTSVVRESSLGGECAGGRGCLFQPWYVGDTYWSYNEVGGDAHILRLTDQCSWGCVTPLAEWDHLGRTGVIGHPFLLGDLLIFASDQSRTGVATYDVSDPTNPILLDVLTTGGPGGYWPEVWGGDGKLYIVFPYRIGGNGMRVVDATDPTNLRFVADTPLPGVESMYAQFQDEFGFLGSYKVDMRTFQPVQYFDPNSERPGQPGVSGVDTSQFALPIGNLLVTGGIGPNEGMAIWAHQAEPDTRGPSVGYHIPRAGQTNYSQRMPISLLIHETLEITTIVNGLTFLVRPIGGAPIAGRITFSFDDVLTFTPDSDLLPDTTYEVVLPEGGIKDAAGNGMVGYSFTFSTGSSVSGNRPPSVDSFSAAPYPATTGATVTLSGSASDPDGDMLEYRFDFGDGSPKSDWSSTSTSTTVYAAPGHYRATFQARDSSGVIASSATSVTVLESAPSGASSSSSQLVCGAADRHLWTINPDNDSLTRIDMDSLAREIEVPVCSDPRSIARRSDGEVWVTCYDDDTLAVHSSDGNAVASVPLAYGSAPYGIVLSPDGNTAYIALEGSGEAIRVDSISRQVTGTLALGPRPRALALSQDGSSLFVSRLLSETDRAEVWEIDTATFTLTRTIEIPKFGGDANRDTTASGRGVANYLVGLAIAPDGESLWVAANKPNSQRGTLFGPDLDQDNTVRNLLVQVDLASGSVQRAIDIDNSDSASAIGFSPNGDYLFVTLQGNDEILVLDALELASTSGLGAFVARLATGSAPQSLCSDSVTGRTFVKNFLSRSVTALETDALFRNGDLSVGSSAISTVTTERLASDVLAGKRIFYNASDERMSPEGYLSCATCHLDGGHDGRTWDFTGRGEGLRNTITLHGRAGTGHGNAHWSGNFDEIQDFENDIRNAFGGLGFLDDADFAATAAPLGAPKAGLSADLDALAAYVASLDATTIPRSPWRADDGATTSEGLAGRSQFVALGCPSCHSEPSFTDSAPGSGTLHNVGTLRTTSGGRLGGPFAGVDTPTLAGLWDTAPYFHDGSAELLDDVFRVAGGVVYPAENATPSGGAWLIDQWVELNSDDTVHGRALVAFGPNPARLTFSGIDGGSGGLGAVEARYSNGYGIDADIVVNGVAYNVWLSTPRNDPSWAHVNWRRVRIEGIALNPGANNTIEFVPNQGVGWSDISLDEIVVSTADDLTAAAPHRAALALTDNDRAALRSYLLQLDGRSVAMATATPTPIPPATPTESPGACSGTPLPDCGAADRARLHASDRGATRRKLDWRWEGSAPLESFGTPVAAGDAYHLCTYVDGSLASTATIPFGGICGTDSCWRGREGRSFTFADRSGANSGITRVQLRRSPRGTRVQVRGSGAGLSSPLPISATSEVAVQLVRDGSDSCWESRLAPPQRQVRADRYRGRM